MHKHIELVAGVCVCVLWTLHKTQTIALLFKHQFTTKYRSLYFLDLDSTLKALKNSIREVVAKESE